MFKKTKIDSDAKIIDKQRVRFFLFIGLICFLISCGDSISGRDILFRIEVDQSQTQLNGDLCSLNFRVQNISSSQEYSLIWMQIYLEDQNGETFEKIYDSGDLEGLLDQLQLPPVSEVEISLDVDLSDADLNVAPYEGALTMIGIGFQRTVNFSGPLICQ